ncbi:MAG: septal ring lytic transglycosylase RlpA family protein [Chitinophagales bacterium]
MRRLTALYILFTLCFAFICNTGFGQAGKTETGTASFYHDKFVGRKTANGEVYSQEKLTAAHKSLPLGTWVKVTNLSNDSVVIVRINDRMPQWNKRTIDLTEKAAGQLNFISSGLAKVKVEVIPSPNLAAKEILFPHDLPVEPITLIEISPLALVDNSRMELLNITDLIDWEVYDMNINKKGKKTD